LREKTVTIEAEVTTAPLGFVDDVVIRDLGQAAQFMAFSTGPVSGRLCQQFDKSGQFCTFTLGHEDQNNPRVF
jgi:hypothetical protein